MTNEDRHEIAGESRQKLCVVRAKTPRLLDGSSPKPNLDTEAYGPYATKIAHSVEKFILLPKPVEVGIAILQSVSEWQYMTYRWLRT